MIKDPNFTFKVFERDFAKGGEVNELKFKKDEEWVLTYEEKKNEYKLFILKNIK